MIHSTQGEILDTVLHQADRPTPFHIMLTTHTTLITIINKLETRQPMLISMITKLQLQSQANLPLHPLLRRYQNHTSPSKALLTELVAQNWRKSTVASRGKWTQRDSLK